LEKSRLMLLTGRAEKRVTIAIPVYLADSNDTSTLERAVTVNLSSHGARVLTRHRWSPGAMPRLLSCLGDRVLQTRVVYCQPLDVHLFSVGLEFQTAVSNWREAFG
jgi:hypothetical protein